MAIDFSKITGDVGLFDFDKGLKETLGAKVEAHAGPVGQDQGEVIKYFLEIPGLTPDLKVPVLFNFPDQPYVEQRWAYIVIRRESITPDFTRWHSYGAIQYRVPKTIVSTTIGPNGYQAGKLKVSVTDTTGFNIGDAIMVQGGGNTARSIIKQVLGPFEIELDREFPMPFDFVNGDTIFTWRKTEEKRQAFPFEIGYTLIVRARWAADAVKMFMTLLKKYQPYVVNTDVPVDETADALQVQDTLKDTRSYEFILESIGSMYETEDVVGRSHGFEMSYRALAELDLNEPEVFNVVTSRQINVKIIP